MKLTKRLLSLAFVLVMVVLLVPFRADAAATDRGALGDINWSYYESEQKLILVGYNAGIMPGYSNEESYPWYKYRDNIKTLVIGSGVHSIGSYAFYNYKNLEEVTPADYVSPLERIDEYAFAKCVNLNYVSNFFWDLKTIGDSAFRDTYSLKKLTISFSVENIGQYAFYASGLTSVTFQDEEGYKASSLKTIGKEAFSGTKLTGELVLPRKLETIGPGAFSFSNMRSVTIKSGVKNIGIFAFGNCANLAEIDFEHETSHPTIADNAFTFVTAVVRYNPSAGWGDMVGQNFGGTLTWKSKISQLANVEIYKTNPHSTGNILYWNAVENGDIYQIYRLNGSSWELLKNTRSLAYKDETAKVGVKHYYKIVARNGDLKSDIKTTPSTAVTRPIPSVLNDVPLTRAIRHATGNILYWTSVEYADVYQIYRKTDGESSFKCIAGTRSLAYKDIDAPAGKAATYYVLAINGSSRSNANTATKASIPAGSVTKLNNVTITKIVPHSSGNILYWDMVVNAQLYQVYRLAPGGTSWELLTNTGSLGYKDTTAQSGVKYYYKIVARNGDVKSDIKTTNSVSGTRP